MFDRPHAFTGGELDVLSRHIVLVIDKSFDASCIMRMRNGAQEPAMRVEHACELHLGGSALGKSGFSCRIKTRRKAIFKGLGQRFGAFARTCRALILNGFTGDENLTYLVKFQLATRLREEMHGRRPAAAHQDQIARDRFFTIGAKLADERRIDAQASG